MVYGMLLSNQSKSQESPYSRIQHYFTSFLSILFFAVFFIMTDCNCNTVINFMASDCEAYKRRLAYSVYFLKSFCITEVLEYKQNN